MGDSGGRRYYPPPRPVDPDLLDDYLQDRLREYNDRDTDAIRRHIDVLREALAQDVDDEVRPIFGGSVSRHTYVDGLSDIDVLMVMSDSALSAESPEAALQRMGELIRIRLPNSGVRVGALAVTITYSDDNEVQVLPAIRTQAGIRIPDPAGNTWSRILHPDRFAAKLTTVNQSNRGQVIPTIKLLKALAHRSVQSDRGRLTGYHIESLAVDAFKNYRGPYNLKSMIDRFTSSASTAVQRPIRDATGQSRYVDEYLGPAGSAARARAAVTIQRMQTSLDACRSKQDLDNLFNS